MGLSAEEDCSLDYWKEYQKLSDERNSFSSHFLMLRITVPTRIAFT